LRDPQQAGLLRDQCSLTPEQRAIVDRIASIDELLATDMPEGNKRMLRQKQYELVLQLPADYDLFPE
jgi:hypothetical protein